MISIYFTWIRIWILDTVDSDSKICFFKPKTQTKHYNHMNLRQNFLRKIKYFKYKSVLKFVFSHCRVNSKTRTDLQQSLKHMLSFELSFHNFINHPRHWQNSRKRLEDNPSWQPLYSLGSKWDYLYYSHPRGVMYGTVTGGNVSNPSNTQLCTNTIEKG